MKKLSELYKGYPEIMIKDIKINSKEVTNSDLFVCIKGVTTDRHDFVLEAVKNGATAIVASKKIDVDVPVIYVKDTNKELIKLSKRFYDYDDNLELIGVTGTNGKTTTALIIKDLIGESCGYIGTNGLIGNKVVEDIKNTTPDCDRLYKYFDILNKDSCKYISMETSSESFYRKRLKGLKFKVGILTNITEDHLNVHKSLKNYIKCKMELFKNVDASGYCILNSDDKYFNEFKKVSKGNILTYGTKESDLQILDVKEEFSDTKIKFKYNDKVYNTISPLVGMFNVYNLAASILALLSLGFDIEFILNNIDKIKVPKGRLEMLDFGQKYKIILDYAHTTDAFIKVYDFLKKVKLGRIITVTGSAGGREHEKRSGMGKIVLDNSDLVIFTMDDPRYENVDSIIDDLISGTDKKNYVRIIDREKAIEYAIKNASDGDIILIAGKGRDNYMAIEDKYVNYCDYDVICKIMHKK